MVRPSIRRKALFATLARAIDENLFFGEDFPTANRTVSADYGARGRELIYF
jgi:hypothetical protein